MEPGLKSNYKDMIFLHIKWRFKPLPEPYPVDIGGSSYAESGILMSSVCLLSYIFLVIIFHTYLV